MKQRVIWTGRVDHKLVLLLTAAAVSGTCLAADPGRLFYTPEQRAQLEAARARNVTQVKPVAPTRVAPEVAPTTVRFDGMVVRSDGKNTRWVNGQPQTGASGVAGLKPGQIRAEGNVYEPYQVLRPSPAAPVAEKAAPEAGAHPANPQSRP